jgi:co-chaperonin GroES (HSP10)
MIIPPKDRAVVRVEHKETVGRSGIVWHTDRKYIGSSDDGYAILRAVVESVGPGKRIRHGEREGERAEMSIRPGDVVFIGRFAGLDLDIERGVDRRIVRENECVLIEGDDGV